MALSRKNKSAEVLGGESPEKIIIVTGPTLGGVVGFLALGAVLGAAGVLAWKKKGSTPGPNSNDPSSESVNVDEKTALIERANTLMQRVKSLSIRARDTIEVARETLAPTIQEAIAEAKTAAAKAERDLQSELDETETEN